MYRVLYTQLLCLHTKYSPKILDITWSGGVKYATLPKYAPPPSHDPQKYHNHSFVPSRISLYIPVLLKVSLSH